MSFFNRRLPVANRKHAPGQLRLYIKHLSPGEINQAVQQGYARCANQAHNISPVYVYFSHYPAALDAVIRKGWCLCKDCQQFYFRNGKKAVVVHMN